MNSGNTSCQYCCAINTPATISLIRDKLYRRDKLEVDILMKLGTMPLVESESCPSGEITPAQALREACENLKFVCGRIKSTFITEMEQVRPNPSLMEE